MRGFGLFGAKGDGVVRFLGSYVRQEDAERRVDDMTREGYRSALLMDMALGAVAQLWTPDGEWSFEEGESL